MVSNKRKDEVNGEQRAAIPSLPTHLLSLSLSHTQVSTFSEGCSNAVKRILGKIEGVLWVVLIGSHVFFWKIGQK